MARDDLAGIPDGETLRRVNPAWKSCVAANMSRSISTCFHAKSLSDSRTNETEASSCRTGTFPHWRIGSPAASPTSVGGPDRRGKRTFVKISPLELSVGKGW